MITKIANGAFSFVYLVQNKESKQYYAAKIINSIDKYSKNQQIFDRKISIIKSFEHPAIIKFVGYSLTDFHGKNNITIIMNLAKNGSLADIIKKSQYSLCDYQYGNTERQIILAGVACGMMYLHNHQIIHHDLKPGNILLDENYYPIITDFGLSKFSDTDNLIEQINPSGTPIYMAPEILSNEKYDQKSDVYSFGIIMYEIVTESKPYPSLEAKKITIQELANKVVNCNYRPSFQGPIKKSIKKLIESCWSKNPKERPTFKEIFKKLAFKNRKKNDEDCFLDDVDCDKLKSYIEIVTKNENNDYFSDEEDEIFSIENFNELCLIDQQLEIVQLIERSGNKKIFITINDFLVYLLNMKEITKESYYLKIKSSENDMNRIYIFANATKILFHNKSFESDDFIIILKEFDEVTFEIEFPSESFTPIYETINQLKSSKKARIKISLLIIRNNEEKENEIQMDEVIINSSLNSIINRSFYNCSSLQEITIPTSVLSIGNLAFFGCSHLYKINLPTSITSIGCGAFEGCISLESISIPSSITMIDCSCFCQCSSLKTVTIPSSITKIGRNAFRECSSLKRISIPSSVEMIGDNVFAGCSNLLEISLPETLILFGMHIFRRCISLMQIEIPFCVPSIRRYSFNECLALKQVTIPTSVVIIEDFAFDGCSSLENISIPSSVVEIGRSSFSRCSSLKEIIVPSSVKNIGDSAFWGCLKLKKVVFDSPDFLNEIGHFAFSGCSSLIEISIPSSVVLIGVSAFSDCSSLKEIHISTSIVSIESSTFSACLSLEKIDIPLSVTEINECAFYGCSSLTEISIPPSVSLIGNYAFLDCSSLKRISIPSSLTNIGDETFPNEANIIRF